MNGASEFDRFADTYDAEINQALSVTGETKDYFARERVKWLKKRLREIGENPRSAIDYGCGIGDTSALLLEHLGLNHVLGLDVSERSVELAEQRHGSSRCSFGSFAGFAPEGSVDLVYCNGVFHHIPPGDRASALSLIHHSLRPGGIFALWENNPWNPGTRYVMSKCEFDRDAVTLTPPQAARMVHDHGFEVVVRDFLFFYPRSLKFLRFSEGWMAGLPLGAQYLVLCRKLS